jgi:hypothetical protein
MPTFLDLSQGVRYDLLLVDPSTGQQHSLGQVLTSLQWEDQQGELAQRVTASFYDYRTPTWSLHEAIKLGGEMSLIADWGTGWQTLIDRVIVFNRKLDAANGGQCSLVAYDPLIYLQKSKFERLYETGKLGKDILKNIFDEFQIPTFKLDGPNAPLPRWPVRGTLVDTINQIFKESWRRGDHEYYCSWREGGIWVTIPGFNDDIYWIRGDQSALSATSEEDIHDLVTEVQITGSSEIVIADDPDPTGAPLAAKGAETEIVTGDTRFGHLREILQAEKTDSQASARETANTILQDRGEPRRTQNFSAPDLPFLRKGDIIRVTAGALDQHCLVSSVVHDAESRTMSITIDNSGTLKRRLRRVKPDRANLFGSDEPEGQIASGFLGTVPIPGIGLP